MLERNYGGGGLGLRVQLEIRLIYRTGKSPNLKSSWRDTVSSIYFLSSTWTLCLFSIQRIRQKFLVSLSAEKKCLLLYPWNTECFSDISCNRFGNLNTAAYLCTRYFTFWVDKCAKCVHSENYADMQCTICTLEKLAWIDGQFTLTKNSRLVTYSGNGLVAIACYICKLLLFCPCF